ncbi:MAG: DNA primase [Trichlorobacter sp.]
MIGADKVREVAERLSIVDVIGEYVTLKRSGTNFTGLCPFHGEKTPSFNVNPAREIFHCFGCGAGGDVFAFVMRLEGISFPEAVRKLAQRAGVVIEERSLTPAELRAKGEREEQRTILDLAARHYREMLTRRPEGAAGRSYLQQREVDPETAAAYGMGYAPERRDTLVQALKGAGHSLETAAALGLIRNGERGNWYDLLHNRLIFPIRDSQGQPIAFAGRVLDSSLPKYINSPESPLYRKSSVLFGLDLALREIRLASSAIVVEGYFDHLALYRAGVRNVVATCGTAMTDGHINLLKKHGDRVYLLFDGDNAGRKATVRAMELCLEQKLPTYVITLPQGEDPDSFLQQHGAEAFQQRIETAKPAFEQYLCWLLAKTPPDSVDRKVRLMDEIAPRFKRIADPVERDLYEKEVCRLLGVELSAFRKRLAGERGQPRPMTQPVAPTMTAPPPPARPRDRTQETLLLLLSHYPGARQEARKTGLTELLDAQHRPLAEALLQEADTSTDESPLWPRIFARLEEPAHQELAARLLMSDQHLVGMEEWRTAFTDCRQRLEQAGIKDLKKLAGRLASMSSDDPGYQQLLERANELRNQKSGLQ